MHDHSALPVEGGGGGGGGGGDTVMILQETLLHLISHC